MKIGYGFHATMVAQPGKGDALEQLLRDTAADGPASHPDCLAFLIARSPSNPDVVFLTEGWTSKEIHDEVFSGEVAVTLPAAFAALLAHEATQSDEMIVAGKFTADLD
jgi:quinol monooxygenase YgiN